MHWFLYSSFLLWVLKALSQLASFTHSHTFILLRIRNTYKFTQIVLSDLTKIQHATLRKHLQPAEQNKFPFQLKWWSESWWRRAGKWEGSIFCFDCFFAPTPNNKVQLSFVWLYSYLNIHCLNSRACEHKLYELCEGAWILNVETIFKHLYSLHYDESSCMSTVHARESRNFLCVFVCFGLELWEWVYQQQQQRRGNPSPPWGNEC